MFNGSGTSPADIAAVVGNRDNDGWGDGNGWWVLIILFALFGGWGGNWGNNGSNGMNGDIQRGFDTQEILSKLNGLNNGLSSLGYDQLAQINAINENISQVGFNLSNAIQQNTIADMQNTNAISTQLSNCCCENREAISQLRYDLTNSINAVNQNVTDQFCQLKMEAKDEKIAEMNAQIQALNLARSQAAQNEYLIGQLRPSPVPAYTVPNPYGFRTDYVGFTPQI